IAIAFAGATNSPACATRIRAKVTAPPAQRTTSTSTPALAFLSLPRQKSHLIPPATTPPPECPPPPTPPGVCAELAWWHQEPMKVQSRLVLPGAAIPLKPPQ